MIEVNGVLRDLLGLGPEHVLAGFPVSEFVVDDDRAGLAALLSGGRVATLTLLRLDGDPVMVEGIVLRSGWRPDLLLLRDVTARERDTALRLGAGRAEALGTLGSAVDRGLQAPLAEIEALLRSLSDEIVHTPTPEGRLQLQEALTSVQRMSSWIETLQLVSVDTGGEHVRPVCLSRIVGAVVSLVSEGHGGSFVVDVRDDLWVVGTPRTLAQALLDVLRNATGGLPADAPTVLIEAIAGDDLVLIVVREDGDPDTFDTETSIPPFPLGLDGAGLGLGACREMIRSLGGRLTVRPGPGGFEIALPRAPARTPRRDP